ncbi:hypothetical protein SAMN05421504_108358 [Amycolatopsis xylanica]|uniref:Uncharacterized protein n=1 Tax=Amycolatopsis xylanica TaxID=589385 RepID=A0A1H3PQW2_9PSEU|nr:hypothetical protein [Amycolatopsis xylanica]SDZ03388.1 hypothetical protein SAMN05421504_108358 [Amycolatopsis xylanica]
MSASERQARFFGGPLDGRVQELGETEPVSGTVVRHVHLHEGPKIETHYALGHSEVSGWEYRLCPIVEPHEDCEPR